MDREQDKLQVLGLFGIFKESLRIIWSWRKIFFKITHIAFVFQLSLMISSVTMMSYFMYRSLIDDIRSFDPSQKGYSYYANLLSNVFSQFTFFWPFYLPSIIYLPILSLHSTSSIAYTVASIYAQKDTAFVNEIRTLSRKLSRRNRVNFLWSSFGSFIYNLVAGLIVFLWAVLFGFSPNPATLPIMIGFSMLYLSGLVYVGMFGQFLKIVGVLEDVHGSEAIVRSKALMKGKMVVGCAIYLFKLVAVISLVVLYFCLEKWVIEWKMDIPFLYHIQVIWVIGVMAIESLIMAMVFLFVRVVETVNFFVCKSFHSEELDMSVLVDLLSSYGGQDVHA